MLTSLCAWYLHTMGLRLLHSCRFVLFGLKCCGCNSCEFYYKATVGCQLNRRYQAKNNAQHCSVNSTAAAPAAINHLHEHVQEKQTHVIKASNILVLGEELCRALLLQFITTLCCLGHDCLLGAVKDDSCSIRAV